jgi:hypothetical protein
MRVWRSPRKRTIPRSTWLGRLLRGRRLDRNPLRRGSDRAETALLGVLLAAFLAGAPFAAHTAGSWTYATSAREAQIQQASLRQVPATLLQAATSAGIDQYGAEVNARWKAPDGQVRTGQVFVFGAAPAGSTVTIWVDQAGRLATSPLDDAEITSRTYLSEAAALVALAVALIVVGLAGRWVLNRRRLAGWDTDWLATEPRWTPRR